MRQKRCPKDSTNHKLFPPKKAREAINEKENTRLMTNKHTKMFKPWYEDNILSPWKTTKVSDKRYVSEKVRHVRANDYDRLGKEWEREFIWNEGY